MCLLVIKYKEDNIYDWEKWTYLNDANKAENIVT